MNKEQRIHWLTTALLIAVMNVAISPLIFVFIVANPIPIWKFGLAEFLINLVFLSVLDELG